MSIYNQACQEYTLNNSKIQTQAVAQTKHAQQCNRRLPHDCDNQNDDSRISSNASCADPKPHPDCAHQSSPEALFLFLLPFGRPRGRFAWVSTADDELGIGAGRLLLDCAALAETLRDGPGSAADWLSFPDRRRSLRYLRRMVRL